MTVLYILDPGTVGGATKSFLTLVAILKDKGVTPVVCTSQHTSLNIQLDGLRIMNFPICHGEMITGGSFGRQLEWYRDLRRRAFFAIQDYKAIQRIKRNVNLDDINLIHTNSTRSDVGFWLSRMTGKPHVVHAREFGDLDFQCYPLNPFWVSCYNRYSTRFICVSDAVRRHWMGKGIHGDKMLTIYNGINYEEIEPARIVVDNTANLRIVMSGSVVETKGQYLAIKAIGLLPEDVKRNITLDLIGWNYESYNTVLNTLCEQGGISANVRLLGAREDILSLYQNYDLGLMCSKSEGFGRVTAEYMFAQLGVIGSDSGATPELIEDGITGLHFKVGNYKSLAEKILFYYNHRDVMAQHAMNAREKALKCYKAETNADNILKVYKEILNG